MKILFITPPDIHYIEPYAYVKADKSNSVRPSLGLLYVAAALRKNMGFEARIIDANADGLTLIDLEKLIAEEAPEIIGFSVLTFNLLNCMEVCNVIRKCSPHSKICFGGWHPTLYPKETLELGCADYIVIGEGEMTFSELVALHENKRHNFDEELGKIKGLGYKTQKGEMTLNASRKLMSNLDDLPFPAYDLVDTSKYSNLLACTGHVVNIMTSRGCPQKCVFCDLRRTSYRFRSPANIMEEVKFWADKGTREFFIQDDNFTINRKRTLEFCRLLTDADLGIKYKISSRVDYIDDELMHHLKKSGCYRIYFGVESGSQEVLDYLEKGITVEQIKKAFSLAQKYGIDRCAYIMIGAPLERREDINMTLRLVKDIKPQHLHCSVCTPMPKTYLYQKMMEEGFIKRDYWLEFAQKPDPFFKTPFISQFFNSQELRDMQNSIQRHFYLNPVIILQEILKTRGLKQFLVKAKMSFKLFFR
jgi:anaerobic magnesium-protoporphyrin IX monomethyl ester cyclase